MFFFSLIPPPPSSTLFPYTTLFRSIVGGVAFVALKSRPTTHPCRVCGVVVADSDLCPTCRHVGRSEEHTSELQSLRHLVCRLLLGKKKKKENSNRLLVKQQELFNDQ